MTRSRQLPSWLSWQSAALELQGRRFSPKALELHFSQLVSVECGKNPSLWY